MKLQVFNQSGAVAEYTRRSPQIEFVLFTLERREQEPPASQSGL
jgi:hypothetical protein